MQVAPKKAVRPQPPPPRAVPSPRRQSSNTSIGSNSSPADGTATLTVHHIGLDLGGAAVLARQLQDRKDDVTDIKVSLLFADDVMALMQTRAKYWKSATSSTGIAGVAAEARDFRSSYLASSDEEERAQDRAHSTMPEMTHVIAEIEKAKQNLALLSQQQQWQQTAGRPYSVTPAGQRPPQRANAPQLVNPYSVAPSQRVMAQLFGGQSDGGPSPPPPQQQAPQSSPPPMYQPPPPQPPYPGGQPPPMYQYAQAPLYAQAPGYAPHPQYNAGPGQQQPPAPRYATNSGGFHAL